MNKYLGIFLTVILSAVLFSGCAKEYSVETNVVPASTVATGTLQDSSGNCLPYSVQGTFYAGIIPSDTSYVQMQVNVYTTGSYNIQTNVQNGFQLSAAGVFITTGINQVNMKASGTPINPMATNFTVMYDSLSCIITVNVIDSI
jgi:PBP1b-binding outer membrane lipoprotein LpoB